MSRTYRKRSITSVQYFSWEVRNCNYSDSTIEKDVALFYSDTNKYRMGKYRKPKDYPVDLFDFDLPDEELPVHVIQDNPIDIKHLADVLCHGNVITIDISSYVEENLPEYIIEKYLKEIYDRVFSIYTIPIYFGDNKTYTNEDMCDYDCV